MTRMRTVHECLHLIRDSDPDTDLTEYCIRRLAKEGRIGSIRTGSKILINFDSLIQLLSEGDQNDYKEN